MNKHTLWDKLYFILLAGYEIEWKHLPNITNICELIQHSQRNNNHETRRNDTKKQDNDL